MKAEFIVSIEGTEVPPGWAEKIEKKLRRDLELSFGTNATVRKMTVLSVHIGRKPAWTDNPHHTMCGIRLAMNDDVSWTTEPGRYPEVTCEQCRKQAGLK